MWRPWSKGHVESEPKGWVGAFNASISLSSLFERLLNWDDQDPSPILISGNNNNTNTTDKSSSSSEIRLLSCAELTHYVLTAGLHRWQRSEMLSYRPTPPPSVKPNPKVASYALSSASLPFSTVAVAHSSRSGGNSSSSSNNDNVAALAMAALPVPQIGVWSFHLPLHRFVAACIREVARRCDDVLSSASGRSNHGGMEKLLQMFALQQDNDDMMASSFQQRLRRNALLFRGLMEFPTIVLSRYVYNACVLLVGGNVLAKSNVMSAYGSANIWQKHLALSDVMKEIPN